MKRRKFIVTGSQAGLGFCIMAMLGESCGTSAHYATATAESDKITVPKLEFQFMKKQEIEERNYVYVRIPGSQVPVGLFKTADGYKACLLRCTHQGCEVEVQGTRYVCPCHGSEFTMTGTVLEGPADTPLKTYKTTEDENYIYIWLA